MIHNQVSDAGKPVVMVTGCSEGGIGHSLCEHFLSSGCTVFATARTVAKMKRLEHLGAHVLSLDVTSLTSIQTAVQEVVGAAGRIDILVNNAGVTMVGPTAEMNVERVREVFETNVFSIVAVTREVVPHMVARGRGKIVNVGSIAAYAPLPFHGIYASSKAAVHALTDSLRLELQPLGIDVVLLAPGAVTSRIGRKAAEVVEMTFKEGSLFKDWEKSVRQSANLTEEGHSMPTEVFARKVVGVILAPSSVRVILYGKFATWVGYVLYYLPLWVRDVVLSGMFLRQKPEGGPEVKKNS